MSFPKKLHDFSLGIFDSGAGGLTVMRAIAESLPNESIVYFGDTARLPYGDKSPETIIRYTSQCIDFLASYPVEMIVIACNTASAYASNMLKEKHQIPIVDVVAPSARKACNITQSGRIAVLGTHATIRSGCYSKAIQSILPHAHIFPIACPLFVPLVEERLTDHPASELLIKEYLKHIPKEVDTLILGCTHYPLLKPLIAKIAGKQIQIVDSASCCAEEVCRVLKKNDKLYPAAHKFFVSDDTERFKKLAASFLPAQWAPAQVELISTD